MKLKDRSIYFIVIAILFIVFYTFFVAEPTGGNVYCKPVWALQISEAITSPSNISYANNTKTLPFISKDFFGYISESGKIIQSIKINNGFSISNSFWTKYTEEFSNTPIFKPDGTEICKIKEKGFIYCKDNRIFIFTPGGNTVKEYSTSGEKIWSYTMPAPITAFDTTTNIGAVIGSSDGYIVYLDKTGNKVFNFYPGGSDYQVILGLAVSHSSNLVACLSGVDKQRFILIDAKGEQHKIIYHKYLDDNLHKQVKILFDYDDLYVIYENSYGLGIVDTKELNTKSVPIKGQLCTNFIKSYDNLFTLLTNNDGICTLTLFDSKRRIIGKTDFNSNIAEHIQKGNQIFINTDSGIAKYNLGGSSNE